MVVLEDLPKFLGVPVRDAARLMSQHLAMQGVTGSAIEPLVTLLTPHLPAYLELLVSDDGASVGLMVDGRGQDFTARLAALLQACAVAPPLIARMLGLHAALDHGRSLLRLELSCDTEPQPYVSIIQRRPILLDRCFELLAAEPVVCAQVRACAALLQQNCVQGVELKVGACSAQPRARVRFTQVVTERRREDVRMRLAQVASRYAPCAAAVSRWAEHHDRWLVAEYAVVSVWLTLGPNESAEVCIEYPQVAVHAAAGWLEERCSEVTSRFEQLCARAGRSTLSYLEVGLQQADWPRLQAAVHAE